MCLYADVSGWKITPRFLDESLGKIMLASILILQFGLLKYFGLKEDNSVLFGLTDNLLRIIQENISLIHDLITEKQKLVWVKKINIFGCHQLKNGYECQDI